MSPVLATTRNISKKLCTSYSYMSSKRLLALPFAIKAPYYFSVFCFLILLARLAACSSFAYVYRDEQKNEDIYDHLVVWEMD